MKFDKNAYTVESLTIAGETLCFRAYRGILYVDRPVNPEYQKMNIFVPEAYYMGKSIHGYTIDTAPVFVPNQVGGYLAALPAEPGEEKRRPGEPNTVFKALCHGYVVASPAIRGSYQAHGNAPACIVDYKAAIRYLHFFADVLPGDENKIITNGTSAGGAISSLIGATGDHPDYLPYLRAVGAADASDAVFAASCYCPITNLDHADAAYEWEFLGVNCFHGRKAVHVENAEPIVTYFVKDMTPQQIQISQELAAQFPSYVNQLGLRDRSGSVLTLDADGEGSFKAHIKALLRISAQRAMDQGVDVSGKQWLKVVDGRVVDIDFAQYVRDITRMKPAPAFDAVTMDSRENMLFGSEECQCRHFTVYGLLHSVAEGQMAEESIIKLMNPMNYLADAQARKARHWRIRHGGCDRDTSLAVSAILSLKLEELGCDVDYHIPWDTPHSGDYDLEELFTWIDKL